MAKKDQDLSTAQYKRRKAALMSERSSWIADYQDITKYLLPRNGRYFSTDHNRGGQRNENIIDSTGTEALDILGAGLMAGMSSPARPWFRLGIPDEDLMQFDPVKAWLFQTGKIMREVFARSNTYRALHGMYEEIGAFGTAASILMPDFRDVTRFYPMTAGEYMISTDERNEVDTLYRDIPMTISQIVAKFGLENCSESVKNQFRRGNLDAWVTITHVIEPRKDRETGKIDGKNKPFKSCYFENSGDPTKPLSEGGFDDFRALTPRWLVRGGDIYGHGPGMRGLGDVIQLQHQQLRKGTAIDYQTNPPLQLPINLRGKENDLLPGGHTYVNMSNPNMAVKTAFEVPLNLNHLSLDMEDVRTRIRKAFYSDLFMMMANDRRSNITATEIAERHEEKLLMLGPVLERLHNEMLSPLIDLTFNDMVKADIVPPPPKELEGHDLKVEFVSPLAQAQRAIGLTSMDKLLVTVGQLAQAKGDPSVWDKLDTDQMIDGYGDMLGVDPQYIVADDRVSFIRAERAKQQQQVQVMEQASAVADTAAKLGGVDTSSENGLTDVLRQFSGYSSNSPA